MKNHEAYNVHCIRISKLLCRVAPQVTGRSKGCYRMTCLKVFKGVCWVQNAHAFRGFVELDLAQRTSTQFGYLKTTSSSSGHGLGKHSCDMCATEPAPSCSFSLTCVRATMARAMMAMEMWIRSKLSTLTDKNEPWTTTRGGKYRIQNRTIGDRCHPQVSMLFYPRDCLLLQEST